MNFAMRIEGELRNPRSQTGQARSNPNDLIHQEDASNCRHGCRLRAAPAVPRVLVALGLPRDSTLLPTRKT
jgi:hypothetical protein